MAKYDKTTHNHLPKRRNRRLRTITLQPKRRSSQSLPTIWKRTEQNTRRTKHGANQVTLKEEKRSELPIGWVWTSMGELCDHVQKVNPKEKPDSEFKYIEIASINNQKQRITDVSICKGKDAPSRAKQLVKNGDTLFSTVRTYLKNIALVG